MRFRSEGFWEWQLPGVPDLLQSTSFYSLLWHVDGKQITSQLRINICINNSKDTYFNRIYAKYAST